MPSTGVGRPRGDAHPRHRPAVVFAAEEAPALAPVPEAVFESQPGYTQAEPP
ncbi:MAG: hypothetical protein ACLQGN_19785 [Mycobacterium sp.]|uniref:hypothetical protein n=1 Tax=Mycobacterium sp. TaxID=1785 RepID=UPI003F984DC6